LEEKLEGVKTVYVKESISTLSSFVNSRSIALDVETWGYHEPFRDKESGVLLTDASVARAC
jgi:hypothetical protein